MLPIFADDAIYLCFSKDRIRNQEQIEPKFVLICNFLNANSLEVNAGKTALTEFSTKQKICKSTGVPPELTVKVTEKNKIVYKQIFDSLYCKTLGVNIRNNLSWDLHLSTGKKAILPAISKKLGALSLLRNVLGQKAKLVLANALLISKLTYLICIWATLQLI